MCKFSERGMGMLYGSARSLTFHPYVETVPRCVVHANVDPTVMFHVKVNMLTITWNFGRRQCVLTRVTRLYKNSPSTGGGTCGACWQGDVACKPSFLGTV